MKQQKDARGAWQKCACGCGKSFRQPATGRRRHYFSDLCRAEASRDRRRAQDLPAGMALAVNSAPLFTPPPQARPRPGVHDDPTDHHRRGAAAASAAATPAHRAAVVHATTTGAMKNFGHAGAQTVIYVREETTREEVKK